MTTILIVDDDEMMLKSLARLLELSELTVETANSPGEALHLLSLKDYSLVITDFQMPAMDGNLLTEKIKASYTDLPVIMVSGTPPDNYKADVLLGKPFKLDILLATIKKLLSS